MNREGWACPVCPRVNSPDILECPCTAGYESAATAFYQGRGVTVIYRSA